MAMTSATIGIIPKQRKTREQEFAMKINKGLSTYAGMLALAGGRLAAGNVQAQSEATECIAPAKPGGGYDLTCRLAANGLEKTGMIDKPMAVSYMPGGIGAVAYNHVNGVTTLATPMDNRMLTYPKLLQRAGYQTALFGKWHLGTRDHFHPQARGFDEFFGFLAGAHSFFPKKKEKT